MLADSSLAKNKMALAISRGVLIPVVLSTRRPVISSISRSISEASVSMGVYVGPGQTALQRIFVPAYCTPMFFVRPSTAAFAEEYAAPAIE